MAEAATKLPVRSEKSATPAPAGNWTVPFDNFRREIDRLFDDFHPFDWRLPSSRTLLGLEMPKLRVSGWAVAPARQRRPPSRILAPTLRQGNGPGSHARSAAWPTGARRYDERSRDKPSVSPDRSAPALH